MKQKLYQIMLCAGLLAVAVGVFSAVPAAAQLNPLEASCQSGGNASEVCNASGSLFGGGNSIWSRIISTVIFLIGAAAVLAIIYGGAQYITAAGDDGQVKTAKNTILYSVAGLVVAIAAYAIVEFVLNRLG